MQIVFCEKSNTVSARDVATLIIRVSPHWLKETHLRYNQGVSSTPSEQRAAWRSSLFLY